MTRTYSVSRTGWLQIMVVTVFWSVFHAVSAQVIVNGNTMTLEQVDTRISVVETALIKAQGDRYRGDPSALRDNSELADEANDIAKLEARLMELRRSYDERIQALDPEVAQKQEAIKSMTSKNAELETLASAIQNQLDAIVTSGGGGVEAFEIQLDQELTVLKNQIARNSVAMQQMSREVLERKREINASDGRAGELFSQIRDAEQVYSDRYSASLIRLAGQEEAKMLDRQRHALVKELQELRSARQAYLKQEAVKEDQNRTDLNLRLPLTEPSRGVEGASELEPRKDP